MGVSTNEIVPVQALLGIKYWRIGLPTRGSSSRRLSKLWYLMISKSIRCSIMKTHNRTTDSQANSSLPCYAYRPIIELVLNNNTWSSYLLKFAWQVRTGLKICIMRNVNVQLISEYRTLGIPDFFSRIQMIQYLNSGLTVVWFLRYCSEPDQKWTFMPYTGPIC